MTTVSLLERPKSIQFFKEISTIIPGGVNSPGRAFKGLEIDPMIVAYGAQDMIYDIDGHGYIDYCGSWGPLILGHAQKDVVLATQQQIALGSTFGLTTLSEEKLARLIIKHLPSIEKIRFVSSGTEATMSAVRLARGFTKKKMLVKFLGNYHGHADIFFRTDDTITLPYNDIQACKNFLLHPDNRDQIAAIIVEPIAGNMGCVKPTENFLKTLREITQEIGALLIFDEVITGFRVALGGAQALYSIIPDITCLGKIIGGGFAAAAFGGKRAIMDFLAPIGTVYQAGTLSGNPVAMVAGIKTIELIEKGDTYKQLEEKTNEITLPLKELLKRKGINACICQVGSMFTLFFGQKSVNNSEEANRCDKLKFAKFFRYMFSHGIYIPPMQLEAWFISLAHTEEHLKKTRDLILDYFKVIE